MRSPITHLFHKKKHAHIYILPPMTHREYFSVKTLLDININMAGSFIQFEAV